MIIFLASSLFSLIQTCHSLYIILLLFFLPCVLFLRRRNILIIVVVSIEQRTRFFFLSKTTEPLFPHVVDVKPQLQSERVMSYSMDSSPPVPSVTMTWNNQVIWWDTSSSQTGKAIKQSSSYTKLKIATKKIKNELKNIIVFYLVHTSHLTQIVEVSTKAEPNRNTQHATIINRKRHHVNELLKKREQQYGPTKQQRKKTRFD